MFIPRSRRGGTGPVCGRLRLRATRTPRWSRSAVCRTASAPRSRPQPRPSRRSPRSLRRNRWCPDRTAAAPGPRSPRQAPTPPRPTASGRTRPCPQRRVWRPRRRSIAADFSLFIIAARPVCSNMFARWTPAEPPTAGSLVAMARAFSSSRLNASWVAKSGRGAPSRTQRAM